MTDDDPTKVQKPKKKAPPMLEVPVEEPSLPTAAAATVALLEHPEWVQEQPVIEYIKAGNVEALNGQGDPAIRYVVRHLVKQRKLTARRHPEHGWWEYKSGELMTPGFAQDVITFMATEAIKTLVLRRRAK
jgi:hypothetical protein